MGKRGPIVLSYLGRIVTDFRLIPSLIAPIINTTVTDPSGRDISSAFKSLVYYYNPKRTAAKELNSGGAEPARILDTCGPSLGLFVESFCNYEDGVPGSIRSYTYKCMNHKKGARNKKLGIAEVSTYNGTCDDKEICVNGPGQEGDWSKGVTITALCIKTDAFVAPNDAKLLEFSGTTLTTLLTSPDMKTPLMGVKIDVEAEFGTSDGTPRHIVSKECSNCLSLTTEKLESNTTSTVLSEAWMEVRAMSIASIAGSILMVILAL